MSLKVLFSIWCYLGWFACIYIGKSEFASLSLVVSMVSWGFLFVSVRMNRLELFRMLGPLLILFGIGILFDSAALRFNWIQIDSLEYLPVWLIALWLHFVASLPLLQMFLQSRYLLAALLGGLFGPLSYQAGSQFEVLILTSSMSFFIYFLFWAIYMPGSLMVLNFSLNRASHLKKKVV